MKKLVRIVILLLCAASFGAAQSTPSPSPLPAIRIILVGDSTMAVNNGWGPGFCDIVIPQVSCVNMAKNGRSSSSYRAEGSWAKVMDKLSDNFKFQTTYVLIQFGHNDQPGKPGRSTDLATEFPVNLKRYVQEVKAAGARPVLITSLTRRRFTSGILENDLAPWAEATKKVAAEQGVPVLDLNGESFAAVQKMGPAEANTLAMEPPPPAIAEAAARGDSPEMPKKKAASGGAPANVPAATASAATAVAATNEVEHTGAATSQFDYTDLGAKGSAFFGRIAEGGPRSAALYSCALAEHPGVQYGKSMTHQQQISIRTNGHGHMHDLTSQVAAAVAASGIRTGTANVFGVGSTAAIGAIEFEPGLQRDLPEVLDKLIPPSRNYGHEQAWHDGNGHSHLQATWLGPSLTVPVADGEPMLGTWQQIFFLECDVRGRQRTVVITVIGDFHDK